MTKVDKRRNREQMKNLGFTQTSQTHAENYVSLTQTTVLGLTQTTQTYTELAALPRSQLSASRVFASRMASTSEASAFL